jgi:hypothetical protein
MKHTHTLRERERQKAETEAERQRQNPTQIKTTIIYSVILKMTYPPFAIYYWSQRPNQVHCVGISTRIRK